MFGLFNKNKRIAEDLFCSAIITAGGKGTRISGDIPKPLIEISGKPIIAYSLESFNVCDLVDEIIIVSKEDDIVRFSNIVEEYGFDKVSKIVVGGQERQDSVYNGLLELDEQTNIVLIHDGARPLVSIDVIENAILKCVDEKAVVTGVKVVDTIKITNKESIITDTPNRENLWIAQTPQVFDYKLITKAYQNAMEEGFYSTDDAGLVERLGHRIRMIEGDYQNIKVTTDEDLLMVEGLVEGNVKWISYS